MQAEMRRLRKLFPSRFPTLWWKNIRKRLDLTKFRTVKSIYMLVNIGYRKYAKEFEIFGADVMADNSDIPEVKKDENSVYHTV